MMSARARRTSSRNRIAAGLVIGVLLAAVGLVAAPTEASSSGFDQDLILTDSTTHVTTSTGRGLSLNFEADFVPSSCATCDDQYTDIYVGLARGGEKHVWDTSPDSSDDVTLPAGSSPGLVDTHGDFGSLGALKITVTPVGSPTSVSCRGKLGGTKQTVTLSGTIVFNTKSRVWGSLGTTAQPMPFTTTATLSRVKSEDCFFGADIEGGCDLGTSWYVDGHGGALFGDVKSTKTHFFYDHEIPVGGLVAGSSRSIERDDTYYGALASAKITRSGKRATIKIKGAGSFATGSGTLSGTRTASKRSTCGPHHTKVTQTSYKTRFSNGSHPFTIHAEAFGSLTVKNGSIGSIDSEHKR